MTTCSKPGASSHPPAAVRRTASRPTVLPGICQLIESSRLVKRRVALAAHGAAVLPDGRHSLDSLLRAGVDVVAALGPEHGFRSGAEAGDAEATTIDGATGVPLIDCYHVEPDHLASVLDSFQVETLVIDLQDAGARYYTYPSTMCDLLIAASRLGIEVVVADRPNPIGGAVRSGPILDARFCSFVGRLAMPLRHGLTMGEIAKLAVEELGLEQASQLEIAGLAGWRRAMQFEETGLPFVPPSPDLPSPSAARCYAGTGLIEGCTLSEGRGTTNPFEVITGTFCDQRLATAMRALELEGVVIAEAHVIPRFGPLAGRRLVGVQLCVVDRHRFDPLRAGLEILAAARRHWPDAFGFLPAQFDRLAGTDELRRELEAGVEPRSILERCAPAVASFGERVEHLLVYRD
jgi:uncharacterized protein YbbC (DUF1343 family)